MASRSYARRMHKEIAASAPLAIALPVNQVDPARMASKPSDMDVRQAISLSAQTLVSVEDRAWAVKILLDELHTLDKLNTAASLPALQAIKLFGRVSQGSQILAQESALRVLLYHAHILPAPNPMPKELSPSALEAWRILCNAIKLHDPAAAKAIEGLESALESILAFLHDPAPRPAHFLASRLLFLLTIKGSEANRTLIEDCLALDVLYEAIQKAASNANQLSAEAVMTLSDQLKLLFNLAVFYPRLLAIDPSDIAPVDYMTPQISSPTTSSRMSPSINDKSSVSSSLGRGLKKVFYKSPSTNNSRPSSPSLSRSSSLQHRAMPSLATPLIDLILNLPDSYNTPLPQQPLNHALHALSEIPCTPEWSVGTATVDLLPGTSTSPNTMETLPPLLAKLLHLLDKAMEYAFPCTVDPDSAANRARLVEAGQRDEVELDGDLAPLLLLIRKCIVGDESGRSRTSTRARLLSDSMDRSVPLDQRHDLTGRLVRLMSSVYYGNTKVGASELLFVLCDQDAEDFSATLGYGPAAGFLASNQLLGAPSESKSKRSDQSTQPVNPITGAYDRPTRSRPEDEMTDQQKADEAEKLFVLFDRMAKTGVMKVDNPIRKAQQSGQLQEIDDAEEARIRAQEEREEQEAIAELSEWKNRNRR